MDEWKEIKKWTWRVLLFGGLVVAGLLVLQFLLMPLRSAVGIAERTAAPGNVIATYERFHDRYQSYNMRLRQIDSHRQLMAGVTDINERYRLTVELNGMRQSCLAAASEYNAESRMTNREIFRGRELPVQLDMEACTR